MQTFASVVDAGSFVRAAESLDMSKAAVSRYVADLEERLGVRLLHRTTRKLSLTEEGRAFHARCKALLGELEEAESEITARIGTGQWTGEDQCAGVFWHPAFGAAVVGLHGAEPQGHARCDAGRPGGGSGGRRLRPCRAHWQPGGFNPHQPKAGVYAHGVVCLSRTISRKHGMPRTPADMPITRCWLTAS
jgi:hypothetical protein